MDARLQSPVINFDCGVAYAFIYLTDEWMNVVSNLSQPHTQYGYGPGKFGGGFKLDQERCHREPPVVIPPGLVSDHEVLS